MTEIELSEEEKKEKLAAIRQSLIESRARVIQDEVRMFAIALCCHDSGVSPLDMAFHIDRRQLVVDAMMTVILELKASIASGE